MTISRRTIQMATGVVQKEIEVVKSVLAEMDSTAGTIITLTVLPTFEHIILYNNNLTQRCIRMKEKNYQRIYHDIIKK